MTAGSSEAVGAYEGTILGIIRDIEVSLPDLFRQPFAIGAPPWFVQRLSAETGERIAEGPSGMDILYLEATCVVGIRSLGRGPLGEFLVQDLLQGGGYRHSLFCHPEVDPGSWESMTLAVREGLSRDAAAELAAIRPFEQG
jgi:hypothetical protein